MGRIATPPGSRTEALLKAIRSAARPWARSRLVSASATSRRRWRQAPSRRRRGSARPTPSSPMPATSRPDGCAPIGRQGHRHPAAQGRARGSPEGAAEEPPISLPGSPPCRPRATTRPCRRRWRYGATSAPRRATRPCPTATALKPGMTDPRVPLLRKRLAELDLDGAGRPRRDGRSLRRSAGRRGEVLPGDQGPDGRRRDRRQDDALAQHLDRRPHRADRGQPRAPALAARGSRQTLRASSMPATIRWCSSTTASSSSRAW